MLLPRRHTKPCISGLTSRTLLLVLKHHKANSFKCHAVQTALGDEKLAGDLEMRFNIADVDGCVSASGERNSVLTGEWYRNGVIDREEFHRFAESLGKGSEYVLFNWLEDKAVDDLFSTYSDPDVAGIPRESFKRLAEDGALLEGRLSEYRGLFERCPSWQPDSSGLGMIDRTCISTLTGRLEHPLTEKQTAEALQSFCTDRECALPEGRISFPDFLNIFREHLLDLKQIEEYMKLEARPRPSFSETEVEAAEANLPEQENGLYLAKSSEQVDALVKVNTDKVVILLAGLSWCRPCMSLTRPLQKLARHYEGAVFAKILGDHSDNTKIFFKDVLKVKATPHIRLYRWGMPAHDHTGANKTKLEDCVRRFYNTECHALPGNVLYPLIPKQANPSMVP